MRYIFLLILTITCALSAIAQDGDPENVAEDDVEVQTAEEPDPDKIQPEVNQETPESFIPTEEISEDLSVSFPVDI